MKQRLGVLSLTSFFFLGRLVTSLAEPMDLPNALMEIRSFSKFQALSPESLARGEVLSGEDGWNGSGCDLSSQALFLIPARMETSSRALALWAMNHGASEGETLAPIFRPEPIERQFPLNAFGSLELTMEGDETMRRFIELSRQVPLNPAVAHLYKEEALQFGGNFTPPQVSAAWRAVLASKAALFMRGGLASIPASETSAGSLEIAEHLFRALGKDKPLADRFMPLLRAIHGGSDPGVRGPFCSWQASKIDSALTMELTAYFDLQDGERMRAADLTYYASSGYLASLRLYELVPTQIDEKEKTLAFRADYVLTPATISLKGMARKVAEKILFLEVKKDIERFRREVQP